MNIHRAIVLMSVLVVLLGTHESKAATISSPSVTILFTSSTENNPYITVDPSTGLQWFLAEGNTCYSTFPVCPAGAYVELVQDQQVLAGSWSDASGHVQFLVPDKFDSSSSFSLMFRQDQSLAAAQGSIHRLTRGEDPERNTGVAPASEMIWLAREQGDGRIVLTSWSRSSGTKSAKDVVFPVGPEKAYRPQPVVNKASSQVWVFYDALLGSDFVVERFDATKNTLTAVSFQNKTPHSIAAAASRSDLAMYLRYSWVAGSTTYICDYQYSMNGSNGSGYLSFLVSPPVLTNLSLASGPDDYAWFAGEENGTVYLYRGSVRISTVPGSKPCIIRLDSGSSTYMALLFLQVEGSKSSVRYQLYRTDGSPLGAPRTLLSIPSASVGRISASQWSGLEVLLFWDQPFMNKRQVFYTKARIEGL